MIRLHIWLRWRLVMRWLYEHTHEPADDGDDFQAELAAKRLDEAAGLRWDRGAIRDRQGRYATLHPIEAAA